MSMSVKKSILHNVNFDLTASGTFITVGSSTPSGMATGNRQEKRLEVSKLEWEDQLCCAVVGSITIILLSAAASMICPATSHQPAAARPELIEYPNHQKIRDKLKISTDRDC